MRWHYALEFNHSADDSLVQQKQRWGVGVVPVLHRPPNPLMLIIMHAAPRRGDRGWASLGLLAGGRVATGDDDKRRELAAVGARKVLVLAALMRRRLFAMVRVSFIVGAGGCVFGMPCYLHSPAVDEWASCSRTRWAKHRERW